jgi:L-fucono-1,5-lactonase
VITIDAHQHFWDPERGDYDWLTREMTRFYRVFAPEDLHGELVDCGVLGTVLVQAAPTEAECDYLLEIAARTPWVLGVVGWLDLRAKDAPERIRARAGCRKFVGVRPMLQDLGDVSWITSSDCGPAFRTLVETDLSFDALIRVPQSGHIAALAEANPELRIVVDHAAKPDVARAERTRWTAAMRALARYPNITCKYSGLLSEAPQGVSQHDLRFYSDTLLDVFGPGRLLWGSDWPILTAVSDYVSWIDMARALVAHVPAASQADIMGQNAITFYRLEAG